MAKIKSDIGMLFVGALLVSACLGPPDTPGDEMPPDSEEGGAPPLCGNLGEACAASEYCLVSSVLQPDSSALILTSDCVPWPPPGCAGTGTTEEICACLSEDAKARNSNCAKPGTAFLCDVRTQSGVTSPRLSLTCSFRP